LEGVPFFGFLPFHGAAEACAHRVDENEVGVIEDGILVIGQFEGRRGHFAIVSEDDAARAEHAHVQPHRRGTGSAVEGEGDRAFPFIFHAVFCVSGEENLRARLFDLRILFLVVDSLLSSPLSLW
jgi:hypothetical protein